MNLHFKSVLDYLKQRIVRILTSMLITLFFILHAMNFASFEWPLLSQLENIAYDIRVNLTMPGGLDERIVIIDIDEKSLAEEGRWPWDRKRMATLIDILFEHYKIGLLGMDVVWAERDKSSGLEILEALAENELRNNASFQQQLERLRPSLDVNQIFMESIQGRAVVLGYYFDTSIEALAGAGNQSGALPPASFSQEASSLFGGQVIQAGGYGANLPELQAVAISAGHFNPFVDTDGIVRSIPMLIKYNNVYYASLSLAISELILGNAEALAHEYEKPDGTGMGTVIESLELGEHSIPVDEYSRALIPFRGKKGSFAYISATDVFNKRISLEQLKGTIALLGPSAPGLVDLRPTPVSSSMPGVELHASMVAGILDQTIKNRPQYTLAIEFLLMVLTGIIMAFLLPVHKPLLTGFITLILFSSVVLINLFFWINENQVLPIASSMALILTLFVFDMSYGFFIEARTKRQLTRLFSQYVPPEQVRKMSQNPEHFIQKGDNRNMTVLFTDVRDFTSISENLKPLELHQLMNEYLSPMTEIIHDHHGTIDKYMGDAIMAFWGAPLPDEQHAQNAVFATRDMLESLKDVNAGFLKKGWPELRVGFGINTGDMIVGDMGSKFRRSYTVMGDSVNLGSRLEGLTKQYGVSTIISEYTRSRIPEMTCRELDHVRVKGKEHPVVIYEPLMHKNSLDNSSLEELSAYELALQAFRGQDWITAETAFQRLHESSNGHKLYALYLKRIDHFKKFPPGTNWDGVFTYQTK